MCTVSDAIHFQNNSCYSLSKWDEEHLMELELPESLCGWRCQNVIETGCGGNNAVSVYKVVQGRSSANCCKKNPAIFHVKTYSECYTRIHILILLYYTYLIQRLAILFDYVHCSNIPLHLHIMHIHEM
jgi:hypothetical protein